MNSSKENTAEEELDDLNWAVIEVSKVDDKIIKQLINYLLSDISEDFFISFESILKVGKKVRRFIKATLKKNENLSRFRIGLLNFIIDFYNNHYQNYYRLLQLYNPDFIIRAKAVMSIDQNSELRYLYFLLPLLKEDPDDSVRWAILKMLISHELVNKPKVKKVLNKCLKTEQNEIIRSKITHILK